jgi:hypothetical protein
MAPMQQPSPPSAATRTAYDALAEGLAPAGVQAGAMFGMPALKLAGKAFAGLFGDAMVFKLAGAPHARALDLAGAALFDPADMGRPMKAWVVVPSAHGERWRELAEAAMHCAEEDALAGGKGAAAKAPAKKMAATTSAAKMPAAKKTAAKKTAAKKTATKKTGTARRA